MLLNQIHSERKVSCAWNVSAFLVWVLIFLKATLQLLPPWSSFCTWRSLERSGYRGTWCSRQTLSPRRNPPRPGPPYTVSRWTPRDAKNVPVPPGSDPWGSHTNTLTAYQRHYQNQFTRETEEETCQLLSVQDMFLVLQRTLYCHSLKKRAFILLQWWPE